MLKTASFLWYFILVFHIVTNFQPSSNSKQFFGTGGNRYLLLRLDKLWRENYTTKANAEENYLSVILNPRLLHCIQFSTPIKLKTSRWHRREWIPVTYTWNTLAWPLHHVGYCWKVSFLLSLILVFYIVPNFQPTSRSKQLPGTGRNRPLSHKLETLLLDLYTTRVTAENDDSGNTLKHFGLPRTLRARAIAEDSCFPSIPHPFFKFVKCVEKDL